MSQLRPLICLLALWCYTPLVAQQVCADNYDSTRLAAVRAKIAMAAMADTTFSSEIDVSVGRTSLAELLRNIARISGVNLSVKGIDEIKTSSTFSRAKIDDLLYFLCKEHNLDVDVVGKIISIYPSKQVPIKSKTPIISVNIATGTLSYNLDGDLLIDVSKRLTNLLGNNVLTPPALYSRQIYGFVDNLPINDAIYALAEVNGLSVAKDKNGTLSIYERQSQNKGEAAVSYFAASSRLSESQLSVDSSGLITAQIDRGDIHDIIVNICQQMGLNYFFVSAVNQQTGIYVRNVTLERLLNVLLSGTDYTYYCENGIYVFGATSKENTLSAVHIFPLSYRSADKIEEIIPSSIKAGLEIKTFADLNSIIVCGDRRQVTRVETFLNSIDKRVPLVTIEIIIVDASTNKIMEAGIGMGLGDKPVKTGGTLSPGINLQMGASSVNKLLSSFSGFGSINMGRVSSDFYLSLKFLEENGVIELRSTPKLSTLNGHEATLKSGETKYYKEVMNSIIGTQNPIQSESFQWKSIEANLIVKIIPYVSQDNHITLDIDIEQTEFTTREEKDAPPGTSTRSFKSLIKVQNEDMVLLGGIDRNRSEKSSSGLPFIARVPVLKWLFGNSVNDKQEHKLNVFIKPTVIE